MKYEKKQIIADYNALTQTATFVINELSEEDYDKAFSFDENINGENVHIVSSKDAVTGWTLVGFISSKETSSTVNS